MDEEPGLSDQYRRASPWPVFVALGLALSEVGVVIGLFAVAVGGLLLLAGSVTGILAESGYVESVWTTLLGFGAVFALLGGALIWSQLGLDLGALVDVVANPGQHGRIVPRALAVGVTGVFLLLAGGTGRVLERTARPA